MRFCVYIVQEPSTDQKQEINGGMGKVGKEDWKEAMEVAASLLFRQLWPSSTSAQEPIINQPETVIGGANKVSEKNGKAQKETLL